MRDLYDQLITAGEPGIAQLVSERRQENVSLEFKTKANPAAGEPTREDRQNLAIALSAFSNSMGGLIVWGLSANKDADGVDCATGLQPIASIERFKADVTRLISQALMPRHEAILVEAIPAQKPRGPGYLAIYVERSERRPHRAELGVARYFKRIGDSSVAMEHYDIEDSFKRLVVPRLEIEWDMATGRGAPINRSGTEPRGAQALCVCGEFWSLPARKISMRVTEKAYFGANCYKTPVGRRISSSPELSEDAAYGGPP
jgi:hypothetical protein